VKNYFFGKKAAGNCFLRKSRPKKEDDKVPTTDKKKREMIVFPIW